MENELWEGENGFQPSLWNVETTPSLSTVGMENNT